jgi:hypothetical protein
MPMIKTKFIYIDRTTTFVCERPYKGEKIMIEGQVFSVDDIVISSTRTSFDMEVFLGPCTRGIDQDFFDDLGWETIKKPHILHSNYI